MEKNENVKIACPYCGAENSLEEKSCAKCGNRISKSAVEKALSSKEEPPIAIKNQKASAAGLVRKGISPLKRRNRSEVEKEDTLPSLEENTTLSEEVVEIIEEPVVEVKVVEEPKENPAEEVVEISVEAPQPLEVEVPHEQEENEIVLVEESAEKLVDTTVLEEIKFDYEVEAVAEEEPSFQDEEPQTAKEEAETSRPSDEFPGEEAPFEVQEDSIVPDENLAEESSKHEEVVTQEEAEVVEGSEGNDGSLATEPEIEDESLESEDQSRVTDTSSFGRVTETNLFAVHDEYYKKTPRVLEEELDDEIILHDDEVDGDEIIDIKAQNDIVKIKNDISEYLKAQEEIELDTTVCLNVPDVMNALYKSEANEDDEYLNTHAYPNLEGEIYEADRGIDASSQGEDHLYEEDDTDLETREYQLDIQELEEEKSSTNVKMEKDKLVGKIKTARKEIKEKKAADTTRLSIPLYLLGVLLRPHVMYKKEEEKLTNFKNVGKLALTLIFAMTVLGLLREMFGAVMMTSYWTGKTSWVWSNLAEIEYFRILGEKLLIYTGIIGSLSAIYYIVGTLMKKKPDIVKLISIVCTAFIPFGVAYGLVALILSIVYAPLGIIVTIIGFIYSMLLFLDFIDEAIVIEEKNKRLLLHLLCLSIVFSMIGMMCYSYLMVTI